MAAHAGASPSSSFASTDADMDLDLDAINTPTTTAANSEHSDHDATPRPELVNEDEPVLIVPALGRRLQKQAERYDVTVVGAGPAGLMLGWVLTSGCWPLFPKTTWLTHE